MLKTKWYHLLDLCQFEVCSLFRFGEIDSRFWPSWNSDLVSACSGIIGLFYGDSKYCMTGVRPWVTFIVVIRGDLIVFGMTFSFVIWVI